MSDQFDLNSPALAAMAEEIKNPNPNKLPVCPSCKAFVENCELRPDGNMVIWMLLCNSCHAIMGMSVNFGMLQQAMQAQQPIIVPGTGMPGNGGIGGVYGGN